MAPTIPDTKRVRAVLDNQENIRILSVISDPHQGKGTLTRSLAGFSGKDGFELKNGADVSLYHEMTEESLEGYSGPRAGNKYVINLIDIPGHVEFSSAATSLLRITDGALVVVDYNEGVRDQSKTLRVAMVERLCPLLTVNNVDRIFIDLLNGEEAYSVLQSVVNDVNMIIDPFLGDAGVYPDNGGVYPEKGTVCFSAGLQGWAFNLSYFAKIYASKYGADESRLLERMWGNFFYDPATKKWTDTNTDSPTCKRGFVHFCYEPIKNIISSCMAITGDEDVKSVKDKKDLLWRKLDKLGVNLKPDEEKLVGDALMNCVMRTWLPASTALLEMIICHSPSPATAQKYRVENLYKGPLADKYAAAIRDCDPQGPLMVYVSKMIPSLNKRKGGYFAFGRVFSGKVKSGMEVRILGPNSCVKKVLHTSIRMGEKMGNVKDVPCGSIVLLGFIDYLNVIVTLTNKQEVDANPIRGMKFPECPVVYMFVECMVASDELKLIQGLKHLEKSDRMVVLSIKKAGKHIIAGAGQLHLQLCLKSLQDFMGGAEIIKSDPIVCFQETVTDRSKGIVRSKSPNDQNFLFMEARPLEDGLAKAIEQGRIGPRDNLENRSKILTEEFGWDKNLVKKIICVGSERAGPNIVVDAREGAELMKVIKDLFVAGFEDALREGGALVEEKMRGICFEVCDADLRTDAIHLGEEEIIKTAKRAINASQLAAKPMLMEPIYLMDIIAPASYEEAIDRVVKHMGGAVVNVNQGPGTALRLECYLPVRKSSVFSSALQGETRGQAVMEYVFDHWVTLKSNPLEAGSLAALFCKFVRKHKGLTPLTNQITGIGFEE